MHMLKCPTCYTTCHTTLKPERTTYSYKKESGGLDSVYLENVLVYTCTHCGNAAPDLKDLDVIWRTICSELAKKEKRLKRLANVIAPPFDCLQALSEAGPNKDIVIRIFIPDSHGR